MILFPWRSVTSTLSGSFQGVIPLDVEVFSPRSGKEVVMKFNRAVHYVALVFMIATIRPVAHAQLTGQITGTITDATGAVVPNADVTITSEATGLKRDVRTNQAGIYILPLLQPGEYRISVQAAGFRGVSRSGVQLQVAQTATLDFKLEIGTTSESVEVTDTAPLLDTGSNAIGGIVTPERVEDLPMLGRNSNALVTLVPGVRATRQTTINPVLESHYQFFSINGSRPQSEPIHAGRRQQHQPHV